MGTPWRGMLAPLDEPTGDGRRIRSGGLTWRDLPVALKWQRVDNMGHDDSVIIGSAEEMMIGTVAQAVSGGWVSAEVVAATTGLTDATLGVWGRGEMFDDADPAVLPRLAEDVAEAKLLTGKKVIGPSIDPGKLEAALVEEGSDEPITEERLEELLEQAYETGVDPPLEMLYMECEVAAATLVAVPAFAECRPFELMPVEDDKPPHECEPGDPDCEEMSALVAAVTGATDLPVTERDHPWDAGAAAGRVFDMCTDGEDVDSACVGRAFLWRDPDADPGTKGAYKLGFADVVDGELRIVPRGVAAAAGGHGVDSTTDIPDDDKDAIRTKICTLYDRIRDEYDDWPECPFDDGGAAAVSAAAGERMRALVASAGPYAPAEAFADPRLDTVTALTLGPDEGGYRRVYGHVAAWGTCHTGIPAACTTPPASHRGYADFHRYTRLPDGRELPVAAGRITVAHGALTGSCACCPGIDDHACNQLTFGAAVAHYDRARTLAYVRAGEDDHGIWWAGVTAPDLDERDLAALGRQKVSGDWRDVAGHLELVEVLVLARERPGFPLPVPTLRHGRPVALVAAGAVRPHLTGPRRPPAGLLPVLDLDYPRLGRAIADHLNHGWAAVPLPPPADATALGTVAVAAAGPGGLVDEGALRVRVAEDLHAQIDADLLAGRARTAADLLAQMGV